MTLIGLRQYWNIEALAFFFGVDKATVSRSPRRVWNALQPLGLASLGRPQPPRKGEGKSVQKALETFPDWLAMIDGTEPRIQRPQDPEAQRQHSSGRRKTHPRKTLLAVDHPGYIRGASFSAPDSQHDLSRTVESGMIRQIPESIMVIGDAGFDGLQNDDPDRSIGTPHKARRNHPLLPDPKRANPELASMRMVVEHTICWLKGFRILSSVFRHMLALYDTVFLAVVGIVNFRMDRRGRKAESVA
ncbi:MAG: transposase family protein [Candidatus Methanomethylicaceae archaeon]